MGDFAKGFERLAAYPHRGRIRRYELGKLFFESDQLADQGVVLSIGDFRRIIVVIEMLMAPDFGAEIGHLEKARLLCWQVHKGSIRREDVWMAYDAIG